MTLEDDRPGDFLDPRATKPVVGDPGTGESTDWRSGHLHTPLSAKVTAMLAISQDPCTFIDDHSAFEDEEVCITPARPIGAEAARLVHDEYDDGMARQALQRAQRNLVPDVDSVLT